MPTNNPTPAGMAAMLRNIRAAQRLAARKDALARQGITYTGPRTRAEVARQVSR